MPTYSSLVKIENLPAATTPTTPASDLAVLGVGPTAYKISINDFVSGATASSFTIGTAAVTGTLGVTGATTLGSTLSVTGNTTVGGTLGVTGAATLSSTLSVTGVSTLRNNVNIGTGNILQITPGSTSATATTIVGSGTGGINFTGTVPVGVNYTNIGRGLTNSWSGTTVPSNLTKIPLYANSGISGTFTGTGSNIAATGYVVTNSANINAGTVADNNLVSAFSAVLVTGGASATSGGWQAGYFYLLDGTLPTNDLAAGGANVFVALQVTRVASKNQGGTGLTPTTAAGANWGIDIVPSLTSTATNLYANTGIEINRTQQAGSSVARSFDLQLSSPAHHVVAGTLWDGFILMHSVSPAVARKDGILFGGNMTPGFPFDSSSKIISMRHGQNPVVNPAVGDIGLDYNDPTFTTASIRVPGAQFLPSGDLNIGSGLVSSISTGISLDTSYSVGTGTPTINSGGSGFTGFVQVPIFDDAYGGVYWGTITGDAISAVTVLRQPRYPSLTPPATLALTARPYCPGSGVVIDGSWDSTQTEIDIAPTDATVVRIGADIYMPSLQASTSYADDAAAAAGGVAIGQLYRNGSVVQIRIT